MPEAVEGVMPGMGAMPGTEGARPGAVGASPGEESGIPKAGVVAGKVDGAVGNAPAGEPVAGGGGVWPKEHSARVREQKETVNSVFIGLKERLVTNPGSGCESAIFINEATASRVKLLANVIRHSGLQRPQVVRSSYLCGM